MAGEDRRHPCLERRRLWVIAAMTNQIAAAADDPAPGCWPRRAMLSALSRIAAKLPHSLLQPMVVGQ